MQERTKILWLKKLSLWWKVLTKGDPDESFWKPRLDTRANGQFIYPNDSHVSIWKDEINLLF